MKVKKCYSIIIISLIILNFGCNSSSVIDDPDIPTDPDPTVSKTESELLDIVQKESFNYFWDYANPTSKLAIERVHLDGTWYDNDLVTTGGSGFGLLNILVGIERGFINRSDAVTRLKTAMNFLENADRFHGAWPHWMLGSTGNVYPFSTYDDGGDLVETAFLCEGLICVREYFKNGNTDEQALAAKADELWKGVEWNWYTKGENVLYWHWSPNYEWQMNLRIEGYNECLITYILAASSPTYAIDSQVYHQGWARDGGIVSYMTSYGIPIVLKHNGTNTVGPLFWAHYSYMGLNPNGLSDQYANYQKLNENHTNIIYQYCLDNPKGYTGYSENVWGLTASYTRNDDGTVGYSAHQPNNDRGVISPTAALSSYPYAHDKSLKFLRYLYETSKGRYVGTLGPYDAISPNYNNWVAKRYLAIDQGTIAPMIENYRTGLIWDLFMNAPEIKQGLINMGFHSTEYNF